MPKTEMYLADAEHTGMRLDVFVTSREEQLSRSFVQKLISDGVVTVNGATPRANYRLKKGDAIVVNVPPPVKLQVRPESIPLAICYEDKDVIVVNKPRGMVVHPAEGNYAGTLVNALLHHCQDLSGINGVLRPGIIHRIDKDTSGLLMVAKNDLAHENLAGQLKEHSVRRGYLALAHGAPAGERGVVDAPIGRDPRDRQRMAVTQRNGKAALTRYRVLERAGNYTWLKLRLETGRTHQIRVHMAYIGCPLVGDSKYGPGKPHFDLNGQFLHAYILGFMHPRSGDYLEFTVPLPKELTVILNKLGIGENIDYKTLLSLE